MLKNKTIISTRPFKGNDPLINLLQAEGVSCLSMPLIKVEKNVLNNEEESLLNNLDQFNWIVFTSANGVRFFFEHLIDSYPEIKFPKKLKTAAVGQATAAALQKEGLTVSLLSQGKTSGDLLSQLKKEIKSKELPKVLLAFGKLAGDIMAEGLDNVADVKRLNVYNTISPKKLDQDLIQRINDNEYDLLILASPSAFHHLKSFFSDEQIRNFRFACIGPTTEKALNDFGVQAKVVANDTTSKGMYESVKIYFDNNIKK